MIKKKEKKESRVEETLQWTAAAGGWRGGISQIRRELGGGAGREGVKKCNRSEEKDKMTDSYS